ncbi:MAG: AAA family ATPase [Bacteroidota bacterium]
MKNYPIGIQTFEKIIKSDLLYIDKTREIHALVHYGGYYFYARPRRFGKSLMLSTIKAIYEGKKALFKGLWIEDQWDWSKTSPVIHFGFSGIGHRVIGLEKAIHQELDKLAEENEITLPDKDYVFKFKYLIEQVAKAKGKIILLIDEYDKPIIDYLGKGIEQAERNRLTLKSFYSVVKDSDPYIEFLMITGVSKFSKVSIFSELNNLIDITFHPRYLSLTGLTQTEIETHFTERIEEIAAENGVTSTELKDKIRAWYNGYSWNTKLFVYNPFSILSYFDFGEFRNFWFETGTPTFLLDIMKQRGVIKINELESDDSVFSSYDIHRLEAIPLLFQTGYLTIKARKDEYLYILDYPNLEVRDSMLRHLIGTLRYEQKVFSRPMVLKVRDALRQKDLEQLIRLIKSIFKNIPNQIFHAEGEFYYHSLIYLVFFYLGDFIESEVNTNGGRLDAVVKTEQYIYLLEFKFNKNAQTALQQIKKKGYAEKYYGDEREKVLLGINFSSESKTVDDWTFEVVV